MLKATEQVRAGGNKGPQVFKPLLPSSMTTLLWGWGAGPHSSSGLGCAICLEAPEPGGEDPGEPVTTTQGPAPGSPCTGVPASSALSGPRQSPPPLEECRGTAGRTKRVRGRSGLPEHRARLDFSLARAWVRKPLRSYVALPLRLDFRLSLLG